MLNDDTLQNVSECFKCSAEPPAQPKRSPRSVRRRDIACAETVLRATPGYAWLRRAQIQILAVGDGATTLTVSHSDPHSDPVTL